MPNSIPTSPHFNKSNRLGIGFMLAMLGLCTHVSAIESGTAAHHQTVPVVKPAEPEQDALIGAVLGFLPLGFMMENGSKGGIIVDFYDIIAEQSGLAINSRIMSYPRLVRAVQLGQSDLHISYRDPLIVADENVIGDMACSGTMLLPQKNISLDNYMNNEELVLAYPQKGYFELTRGADFKGIKVQIFRSEQMLFLFQSKRVDAIAIGHWVLQSLGYRPEQFGSATARLTGKFDHGEPVYLHKSLISLSVNPKTVSADTRAALRRGLEAAKKAGLFNKALASYGVTSRLCEP